MALADTTFFIDLMAETDGAVAKLDELIELGEPLWVPSIALHELYDSAHLHTKADRETDRIRELERALPPVGFTPDAARIAGRIEAEMQADGERPDRADIQIAATALARGEAVVTRDERFEAIEGLQVERY